MLASGSSSLRPIAYHAVFFDSPRQPVSRAWIMQDKILSFKDVKVGILRNSLFEVLLFQFCICIFPSSPLKIYAIGRTKHYYWVLSCRLIVGRIWHSLLIEASIEHLVAIKMVFSLKRLPELWGWRGQSNQQWRPVSSRSFRAGRSSASQTGLE